MNNNTKHIIAKVKGKAREEYFPTIDDIMTKHPSITVVDNCLYTGGCFDSTDPLFLNEILTTEGFYLTDTDRCIKFLVSLNLAFCIFIPLSDTRNFIHLSVSVK